MPSSFIDVNDLMMKLKGIGVGWILPDHMTRNINIIFCRYFIKALAVFPRHSSIHLKYAGFLRHVRKDMERATKHYKEAVEANPHYADALGSYASFLHSTTGGGDKKLTESLYRRAVEVTSLTVFVLLVLISFAP